MSKFLKLQSKSNRFYHELTREYDLKPLDAIVLNYLINALKKSVSHGERGSNGKCFYRHDKKVTGFYWATTLTKLKNDVPCHIGSTTTLESSLGRLQHKYGFIYKHQTIRTSKNGIQIFMPLLDLAIRYNLNDDSYQTIINCKDGKHVKNCLIDTLKSNRTFYQKLIDRYVKNCKNNNHHVINHHKTNHHINNNVVVSSHNEKPNNNNNNSKHRQSKGSKLPTTVRKYLNKKIIKTLYDNLKSTKKVIEYATTIISVIFKVNRKCINIRGTKYFKPQTNPFIQDGSLFSCLGDVFVCHASLKETIKDYYVKYINENSDLEFNKQVSRDKKLYEGFNSATYEDSLEDCRKQMAKYKNKDNSKYNKAKSEFNKWVRLACKYTDLQPWAIKGTKEYNEQQNYDPTPKEHVKKIDIQMAKSTIQEYDLDISPEKFAIIKNDYLDEYRLEYNVNKLNECKYNGKAVRSTVEYVKDSNCIDNDKKKQTA